MSNPPMTARCVANHRSVPADSAASVPNGLKESAAIEATAQAILDARAVIPIHRWPISTIR